jgi:hypothetical protein
MSQRFNALVNLTGFFAGASLYALLLVGALGMYEARDPGAGANARL